MNRIFLKLGLVMLLLAGCTPKAQPTPDLAQQINQLVAATIIALPTAAPLPTYTPYPTSTPFELAGLFCEYQFCIGHPTEVTFFDLSAQKNPLSPSNYELGILAAVNNSLYIQLIWQRSPGVTDPQFLLDLILIGQADTRIGDPEVRLERGMNIVYSTITSTATVLPNGGAGAWVCGDRVFAWKAYTEQTETARTLFQDAFARFTCGQNP